MDNREIEKRIHAAVCSATPDKLDDIMKACGIGEQTEQQPERKKRRQQILLQSLRQRRKIYWLFYENCCIIIDTRYK